MGWFDAVQKVSATLVSGGSLVDVNRHQAVEVETLDPEPTPIGATYNTQGIRIPDKVPLKAGLFTNDRNVYSNTGVLVGTAKTGTGGNWGSTYTRPVQEISDASLDSEESRNIAKLTVTYTAEQIQAIKGLSNAPATSQFLCGDL